jgi:hypothetical protein
MRSNWQKQSSGATTGSNLFDGAVGQRGDPVTSGAAAGSNPDCSTLRICYNDGGKASSFPFVSPKNVLSCKDENPTMMKGLKSSGKINLSREGFSSICKSLHTLFLGKIQKTPFFS